MILLVEKYEQAQKLTKQLVRSLAIAELWPGVFEFGPAKSRWIGSPWRGSRWELVRGDGEVKSWNESEAPEIAGEPPQYVAGKIVI